MIGSQVCSFHNILVCCGFCWVYLKKKKEEEEAWGHDDNLARRGTTIKTEDLRLNLWIHIVEGGEC